MFMRKNSTKYPRRPSAESATKRDTPVQNVNGEAGERRLPGPSSTSIEATAGPVKRGSSLRCVRALTQTSRRLVGTSIPAHLRT